jgi:phosphoserine phosphatase
MIEDLRRVAGLRLIAFDFDGTLIDGRLIDTLARRFHFEGKLRRVFEETSPGHEQSLRVAELLKGIPLSEVLEASKSLTFTPGARETIKALKGRGYIIGVISDSYKQAIEAALEDLPVDFVEANELEEDGGVLTGKIRMPLGWAKDEGCLNHSVCKLTALGRVAKRFGVGMKETVAVGNGEVDICMVEAAGLGIAFNPISSDLKRVADVVIDGKDLKKILKYI